MWQYSETNWFLGLHSETGTIHFIPIPRPSSRASHTDAWTPQITYPKPICILHLSLHLKKVDFWPDLWHSLPLGRWPRVEAHTDPGGIQDSAYTEQSLKGRTRTTKEQAPWSANFLPHWDRGQCQNTARKRQSPEQKSSLSGRYWVVNWKCQKQYNPGQTHVPVSFSYSPLWHSITK